MGTGDIANARGVCALWLLIATVARAQPSMCNFCTPWFINCIIYNCNALGISARSYKLVN